MARFFAIPFATSATKTTIPDTDSESVSWSNGYTVFYEYDPTVSANNAKHVERSIFNTLLYDITSSLQAIQLNGIAPYYDAVIAASGPGYNEGSLIFYNNKLWRSKKSGNKVRPNESTKESWEEVTGYDSLVTKLKNDGYVGDSGNGGGDGYTKDEVDMLINNLSLTLEEYYYKDPGEIFLLSWCDEDRNASGFFLCNGDAFPYTDSEPTTSQEFYGNALYSLCYDDDGKETDFKTRWDIQISTSAKTIALPNILQVTGDDYMSDKANFLVTLGRNAGIHGLTSSSDHITVFANDPSPGQAYQRGDLAVRVTMLPCIYLGLYSEG